MNQILLSVLIAFVFSQGFKILYNIIQRKEVHIQYLFETGGMPSTHSAIVVALFTSIYLFEGFTTSFLISVILAFIVIRDATGVRYTVGLEGKYIKKLLQKHKMKDAPNFALGHTPLQVLIGSAIGIISVLIVLVV